MAPLRVVPLGGAGEVGMNCLAVERGEDVLVIDCGVMFPGEDVGINVIHPDLRHLLDPSKRVRGVVLTHGHEDHVGGVPYLLRALDVPVYGPAYATSLVVERLRQMDLRRPARIERIRPGETLELGPFSVSPIRVTHSMADATALAIQTPDHLVVHTGDYRIDPDPVDGEAMDLDRLGELGALGVDLLLSDSTNVEIPGACGSERSVASTIEAAARETPGRVFVAVFSSNTPRVQLMLDLAERLGRKVVLAGRSVLNHTRIAMGLGYLRCRSDLLFPLERAAELEPARTFVVMSGTQGEPFSALGRLASGRLKGLAAEPGDLVVISGRFIPGNELAIYNAVSDLSRRGARVLHSRKEAGVHVSGHAHRDEQRRMLELVRPRCFVPLHGAYHHLAGHADLAREVGVEQVLVVENGRPAVLDGDELREGDPIEAGRVYVDGVAGVSDEILRDRRNLRGGIALAVLVLDLERGELVHPPEVIGRGVGDEGTFPALWSGASAAVAEAVAAAPAEVRRDPGAVEDVASRALRRYLSRTLDRRPTSLAVVVGPCPGRTHNDCL